MSALAIYPDGDIDLIQTMGAARKKEIYDVCVEYGQCDSRFLLSNVFTRAILDIIIVEDDPYFFLQQGEYSPKAARADSMDAISEEAWISTLAPSFLKFDYEGRVIRLDTFSKVKATYNLLRTAAH